MIHSDQHNRHVTTALRNFLIENKVPNRAYNMYTSEKTYVNILSYHTQLCDALDKISLKVSYYVVCLCYNSLY